jgi:hypothetical protein
MKTLTKASFLRSNLVPGGNTEIESPPPAVESIQQRLHQAEWFILRERTILTPPSQIPAE